MRHLLTFSLLLACWPAAHAVNKCTGDDGKVSYQSEPCPSKARSSAVKITDTRSARAAEPATEESPGRPRQTEAERLTALTERGLSEQRRRELEQTAIPTAAMQIDQLRQSCSQRNATLEAQKYAYAQNMWGVANRNAVASEQAALSVQCDSQVRTLQEHLGSLREECRKLSCGAR